MTRVCSNCGKIVGDSEKVCPYCGSPLDNHKAIKVKEVSPMTFHEQKMLIMFGVLFSIILIVAGTVFIFSGTGLIDHGITFNLFTQSKHTQLANNTSSNITANQSQVNQTNTTVQPKPEKTPVEKIDDYLNSHPISTFGNQSSRILSVTIGGDTGYLTYRTTKVDPSSESTYLAGVMFLVFPDIQKTDIRGYNSNGEFINASWKNPSRKDYNFDYYKIWFGDINKTPECTTNADCNDYNNCTFDKCYNGMCSNVEIIGCS